MKMKKTLLPVLSLTLACSFGSSVFAFSDTGAHPYQQQIAALQQEGIVSGVSDNAFLPQGKLTYASGIMLLVKGLDISLARFLFPKAPLASDYFTNVPVGQWYSDAFIVAHVNGLEIPKDVRPEDTMTREQFAQLLLQGIEANGPHAYIEMAAIINDEADISPAFRSAIQTLVVTKIISLDSGSFKPKAEITRGEAAGWLYNARQFAANTPVVPPQPEEPQQSPLTDVKLDVTSVNEQVYQVTVSATAPHPGYGIRITSIAFTDTEAVIQTAPVLPDPDKMYPQVLTEVKAVTYVDAAHKPVLPGSTPPAAQSQ